MPDSFTYLKGIIANLVDVTKAELKPDLITMDIRMPVMDGVEATRMIMATNPTPIVVISSSVNRGELRTTFRAIEEGALAIMDKPKSGNGQAFEERRRDILATIRAMATVRVVRRRLSRPVPPEVDILAETLISAPEAGKLVALGCSTGGPQVLQYVLSSLPIGFPAPIVIAQHMSAGFIGGLVDWLKGNTMLNARLAADNEELQDGTIYFAPEDRHIRVVNRITGIRCESLSGFCHRWAADRHGQRWRRRSAGDATGTMCHFCSG